MVLVLPIPLGSDYPYNWVTHRPSSSVDITPEVKKREGYDPPPPSASPSLPGQTLRPPHTRGSDAAASRIPLHPFRPLTRGKSRDRGWPPALASKHTCVFLRQHWPAYNFLKSRNPLQLVVLRLAGEEEFPIRGDNSYPVLPVVSLRGWREPFQDLVAVFLAPNKNFPSSKGILGDSRAVRQGSRRGALRPGQPGHGSPCSIQKPHQQSAAAKHQKHQPPHEVPLQLLPGTPTIQDQHRGSKIQMQKNLHQGFQSIFGEGTGLDTRQIPLAVTAQCPLGSPTSLSITADDYYYLLLLLPPLLLLLLLQIIPNRQPRHLHLTRGSLKYMSRRSSMVNHRFLNPSVC